MSKPAAIIGSHSRSSIAATDMVTGCWAVPFEKQPAELPRYIAANSN